MPGRFHGRGCLIDMSQGCHLSGMTKRARRDDDRIRQIEPAELDSKIDVQPIREGIPMHRSRPAVVASLPTVVTDLLTGPLWPVS